MNKGTLKVRLQMTRTTEKILKALIRAKTKTTRMIKRTLQSRRKLKLQRSSRHTKRRITGLQISLYSTCRMLAM